MQISIDELARRIDVAAGRAPADLVLRNGRIVDVAACGVYEGDIAIAGEAIAGVGHYADGPSLDLRGAYVCPGLMDAHVHIESSMLDVPEFARAVSAAGTTAVMADPHEFANVAGLAGIQHVLELSQATPLDVFVMLSSCVPASPLESAGATLNADDLRPLMSHARVLGLAEMMNYPGVTGGDAGVLAKLALADGRTLDGHAPGLTGRDLMAYAAAGIESDHECIRAEEALEKLRAGLFIMVREGSQTRNLEALLPLIRLETADRFMFCTDDKDVRDILDEGHIDYILRKAVAGGLNPLLAVKCATLNTARYFGLRRHGLVAPGYRANLAVVEDLNGFKVLRVIHAGRLVAEGGHCVATDTPPRVSPDLCGTVRAHDISVEDLRIAAPSGSVTPSVHVIEVLENRIDTERSRAIAPVRDGRLVADPARDMAKLVVVERHRASGRVAKAFARGFKLRTGALASSVAHDAHNLVAVGVNDRDIVVALRHLVGLGGGLVVVQDGNVTADVPLPIAGLVTDRPAVETAERLRRATERARALGCELAQPFMCLAFLSLSVIGKLKLTDQGLIDVERFEPIELIA